MSKLIKQSVVFKTTPHNVYEALMDSAKHAAFSKSAALMSREVGGEIMAYDGYVVGKNLELDPDHKIIQSWKAEGWPEDHFSIVTFLLKPVEEGT